MFAGKSSSSYSTTTDIKVNIGTQSDTWSITTKDQPVSSGGGSGGSGRGTATTKKTSNTIKGTTSLTGSSDNSPLLVCKNQIKNAIKKSDLTKLKIVVKKVNNQNIIFIVPTFDLEKLNQAIAKLNNKIIEIIGKRNINGNQLKKVLKNYNLFLLTLHFVHNDKNTDMRICSKQYITNLVESLK